eukprot:8308008-Pyramimonas_sp.AAC.1
MVTQEASLVVTVAAAFLHTMRLSAVVDHSTLTWRLTAANVALLLAGWVCRALLACYGGGDNKPASLAMPPVATMVGPTTHRRRDTNVTHGHDHTPQACHKRNTWARSPSLMHGC